GRTQTDGRQSAAVFVLQRRRWRVRWRVERRPIGEPDPLEHLRVTMIAPQRREAGADEDLGEFAAHAEELLDVLQRLVVIADGQVHLGEEAGGDELTLGDRLQLLQDRPR